MERSLLRPSVMRIASVLFVTLVVLAGCGGDGQTSSGLGVPSCHWPDGVSAATDASTKGCFAHPDVQVCEVRSDGTQSCKNRCSASQYGLSCDEASPATACGCQIVPIPTPLHVAIYCCPCT